MNPLFVDILGAPEADRLGLFVDTAARLGTTAANAEKDFWVCWTLDVLFNGLPAGGPRLLFKGGTSLSKAFGLIERFSEDIDVTVFRDDLGQTATIDDLEALGSKKRRGKLDAIRDACREFIRGDLRNDVGAALSRTLEAAGLPVDSGRIEEDEEDPDGQTLLVRYPSLTLDDAGYVRRAVKIESGAKSALDPNSEHTIEPYVAADVPALDLRVPGVVTIDAERTFWDKVIILHGLCMWYGRRGELKQEGQRISRHYYDVSRLMSAATGPAAAADWDLGAECVRHARMFFNRPDFRLDLARPGTFALAPRPGMLDALRRDYERMAEMIFGTAPPFEEVVTAASQLEEVLNARAR